MSFAGSNPERLRSLAAEADAVSEVVRQSKTTLTRLVEQLPSLWAGQDADAFASRVSGEHVPSLNRAIERLGYAAYSMRAAADEQEATSASLH